MKLTEAREQLVASWGSIGGHWGINRTLAQIHALLLANSRPMSTEDIMAELNISRGNANMNIRELIAWGLVKKVVVAGERKEFFVAAKDAWTIVGIIARERKKRELEPLIKALEQITIEEEDQSAEAMELRKTIADMERFALQAGKTLDLMATADQHWFIGNLIKWLG